MNSIELKTGIHAFIDQIDNIHLLEDYYQEMKKLIKSSHYSIWDTLSDDQKQEVLLSFKESEDDNNLIDNDEVMKTYQKWL